MTQFGSNRDRHAAPGEGLIGAKGLGIFMSHPKLQGLPAILEGPGTGGAEAQLEDVRNLRKIHKAGLKARAK